MTLTPWHFNNPPFHWDNPFQEQYNVMSYGAKGDGVTNDRAAIIATIEAALDNLPATVYFPPGTYAIQDQGIEINPALSSKGLSIVGDGKGVTTLVLTGDSTFDGGGQWHCLRIRPTLTDNVGITDNLDGTYTVEKTAHGYTTGDTVDIHDAVPAGLNGRYVITVEDADNFNYPLTTGLGNSSTHGESISHDEFLSDFSVHGITFKDDDPATHAGATEETHGVNIQSCKNVSITDCGFDSIGDEGVELDYIIGGVVSHNYCTKTPHEEQTGGGALSIKNGCKDIAVANNIIQNQNLGNGANVYGINVKLINPFDVDGVTIADNVISDCVSAGIRIGTSDTTGNGELLNITVSGNTIKNCPRGVFRDGGYISRQISVLGNVIDACPNGIDFDVGVGDNLDCNVSFNMIKDCTDTGITVNGTRLMLSGNNMNTCVRGIHVFVGSDVSIVGGMFESCGGTNLEEIEAQTCDNLNVVGVQILNSNSSSGCIKGGDNGRTNVKDCVIERAVGATFADHMIFNATNVTGCDLQGGIRLLSTATGGVISGNKITYAAEGGTANTKQAIEIAAGNDYYSITGNSIDTSASANNQYCIDIASGATNTVVVGNSLQATTAGAGNTINDAGTGTVSASNATT